VHYREVTGMDLTAGLQQIQKTRYKLYAYMQFYFLSDNQRDAALSSRIYLFFSARLLYTFRVLSAPIVRSTIKTADAIIGTVHVSVWFKSVERCPSSGVYFTMSWPNEP
jgi:hypothetical protein